MIIVAIIVLIPLLGGLALTRPLRAMPAARHAPRLATVLWLLPAAGYLAWAIWLLRDGFLDPTSRNLWPIEMVFVLFYWAVWAAFVWVLFRIAGALRVWIGTDGG